MSATERMAWAESQETKTTVLHYMVKIATQVVGEACNATGQPSVTAHLLRVEYAKKTLAGQANVAKMAEVVATNASIGATIDAGNPVPDGDIEYAVTTMWNDMSGCDE